MKCSHCGGSVIYHPGNCLEQAVNKCMACGREGREKMETKTKKCSMCLEEKPLELFSMNRTRPDGHESRCKDCMKKKMQDYRDKKVGDRSQKSEGRRQKSEGRSRRQKQGSSKPLPVVTRATPEQIIADLRRGLAIEIIDMIQEKFGL